MARKRPKLEVRKPPSPESFVAAGSDVRRQVTSTGRSRITVWLPADIAVALDELCLRERRTRAFYIEGALRKLLHR